MLLSFYPTAPAGQAARGKAMQAPEYDPKEGEPPYDGFTINHTEIFSNDRHRMYYFPKDQYPDLYLHRQVCQEQAQRTFVDLYRLIQGG